MDARFQELADTGRLPSPSGIGARILSLTQDPDVTIDDIASAITHDPALTGRLLRVANSASTAGSVPLSNAQEATMRLGLKSVSSIAVGFTLVANNREGVCDGFDYAAYWSRAMAIAVTAQALCREAAPELAAEAFTAGLMLEIGQMAFASAEPEVYAGIQRLMLRGAGDLRDMEQRNFGNDHYTMGAWLLSEWGMPELFSTVQRLVGQGRIDELEAICLDPTIAKLAQAMIAASHLAHNHIGKAEPDWMEDSTLSELLGDLGLDVLDFGAMLPAIEHAWRELAADLEFKPLPPLELEACEQEAPQPEADSPLVLVVDTNAIARKIATNCLHRAGIRVTTAATHSDAIAIALEHQPVVLVVDWAPVEAGAEDLSLALCQALRRCEAGRKLFVLALCKHEHEEACMAAFDAEADDFLTKPFAPKDMINRIEMGLRLSVAQDSLSDRRTLGEDTTESCDIDILAASDAALSLNSGRCLVTGLPDRHFAISRLANHLADPEKQTTIVGVSIDGLTEVGIETHSKLNLELAGYLADTLRKGDLVTCSSPGVFILLCPKTNQDGARLLAKRLSAGARVHLASVGLSAGLSICVGASDQAGETAEALVTRVEFSLEFDGGQGRIFDAA